MPIPERWKGAHAAKTSCGLNAADRALRREGPMYLPRLVEALETVLPYVPRRHGAKVDQLLAEIQRGPQ